MLETVTNDHLHLLKRFDNHLRWLKEGYIEREMYVEDNQEVLDFDTLFKFHIRKLEGVLGDFADYFNAKKEWVQRSIDSQEMVSELEASPSDRGEYRRSIGEVDERWR